MSVSGMIIVMHIYEYLYILFLFVLRTIAANVPVLTDANFTSRIRNYEVALVKFYVPR